MTTIETTGTVVTAVFHHVLRYARTPDEIDELVRTAVDDPPLQPAELCTWDRPCRSWRDEVGQAFPGHKLRVCTTPATGWGAVSYHNGTPGKQDLADSYNPDAREDTPALLFDPEGDLWFPASASLPLDQVRQAVAEYCRTGRRPQCIQWQLGEYV